MTADELEKRLIIGERIGIKVLILILGLAVGTVYTAKANIKSLFLSDNTALCGIQTKLPDGTWSECIPFTEEMRVCDCAGNVSEIRPDKTKPANLESP